MKLSKEIKDFGEWATRTGNCPGCTWYEDISQKAEVLESRLAEAEAKLDTAGEKLRASLKKEYEHHGYSQGYYLYEEVIAALDSESEKRKGEENE